MRAKFPDNMGRSRNEQRRAWGPVLVSVGVHVAAILVLAHVLAIPTRLVQLFERERVSIPVERIGFVSLPSPGSEIAPGRRGGDNRRLGAEPSRPSLVAPSIISEGVPAPAPIATIRDESGTGPLVGGGGPTRGVRPAFRDPRLWQAPSDVVVAPKSVREMIDEIIAADVASVTDSSAAARPPRWATGDWTVERNGRKYGIDPQFIRLGVVSIPTSVLALMPLNVSRNPSAYERDRALAYMNRDINYHASRAITEDEFRRNVRNLRQRKERERAEQQARKEKERPTDLPAAPQGDRTN